MGRRSEVGHLNILTSTVATELMLAPQARNGGDLANPRDLGMKVMLDQVTIVLFV